MAGLIQKTSPKEEVEETFRGRNTDYSGACYVSLLLLQYNAVKEQPATTLLVAKRQV